MIVILNKQEKKVNNSEKKVLIEMLSNPEKLFLEMKSLIFLV